MGPAMVSSGAVIFCSLSRLMNDYKLIFWMMYGSKSFWLRLDATYLKKGKKISNFSFLVH